MTAAIEQMLQRYACHEPGEYERALKEIIQEIALVGLWRAHFFERAAFYGGTSLRILHGLNRFSEDLDFTLFQTDLKFDLSHYHNSLRLELESFGFKTEIVKKEKSSVQSAFIKMNTVQELLKIGVEEGKIRGVHPQTLLKIKFEIDTDPPPGATIDVRYLYQPIPCSVKTLILPDSFAGKIHACLCRQWKNRVKGRDWFDFIWFVGKNTPLNLRYLESRLRQSGGLTNENLLTPNSTVEMLANKIEQIDIEKAKQDVLPFIQDKESVAVWSKEFFLSTIERIQFL